MRSAVDEILRFNRGFHGPSLKLKLEKMGSSPFAFFRGTFHLFARDLQEGTFRKWPSTQAHGQIVADLHTENFGTFRAIRGEIVYDINDFDETTEAPYEYDVRRLATSLLLAALDNKHPLGVGLLGAEACVRGYLGGLQRFGRIRTRAEFQRLKDHKDVRQVLSSAAERSRVEMLKGMVQEKTPGNFSFKKMPNYAPVEATVAEAVREALPKFLKNRVTLPGAHPEPYRLQDVAFRYAGCGSLGRVRYGLLLGRGKEPDTWETLRLVEWKDSLVSALDVRKPESTKARPREVIEATVGFQLWPKRYLGYTNVGGRPMQGREIGANDARFQHQEFMEPARFQHAAQIFGEITARAHLLSTLRQIGPRGLLKELAGAKQERWVQRMLAFSVAYADRMLDDYQEFSERRGEIAKKWGVPVRKVA
jgi:uncharacterized protein (DUF2252 family)